MIASISPNSVEEVERERDELQRRLTLAQNLAETLSKKVRDQRLNASFDAGSVNSTSNLNRERDFSVSVGIEMKQEMKQENQKKTKEILQLISKLNSREDECVKLTLLNRKLQGDLLLSQSAVGNANAMESRVAVLESERKEMMDQIKALTDTLKDTEHRFQSEHTGRKSLERQLNEEKKEKDVMQEQIHEYKFIITDAEKKVQQLKSNVRTITEEVETLNNTNTEIKAQMTEVRASNTMYQQERAGQLRHLSQLEEELRAAEKEGRESRSALVSLIFKRLFLYAFNILFHVG